MFPDKRCNHASTMLNTVSIPFRSVPRLRPRPMKRQRLPQPWCERLVLDDGRELLVRPIQREDVEPLQQSFSLLTHEEIRLRFLHPMRELSAELALQLCSPDRRREIALVAAEPLPAGNALIGAVGRVAIDKTANRGEFAIIVGRQLAHQGLGRYLMKKLIRWARLKRLDEIYGEVLEENSSMLALADSLGFKRSHTPGERGTVHITLQLR